MIDKQNIFPTFNVVLPLDIFQEEDKKLQEQCPMIYMALPSGLTDIVSSALATFSLNGNKSDEVNDIENPVNSYLDECFNLMDTFLTDEKNNYGFLSELPVDSSTELYSVAIHEILLATFKKVEQLLKSTFQTNFVIISDFYYPRGQAIVVKVKIFENTHQHVYPIQTTTNYRTRNW
jgi:hypothetical protein